LQKRIAATWEPAPAERNITPTKLHLVAKAEPAQARPTLVQQPPADRNKSAREETNPLDGLDWEERFWFAFQAIVELERDLEELLSREKYFQCITCRRESGLP
jgi:hypothetical protein